MKQMFFVNAFLSTLLLTTCAVLFSQNKIWLQTNGPYGGTIRALGTNITGDIFATTATGHVFRSRDNGNSWEPIKLNNDAEIYSLAFNSNGYIFGAGYGGVHRSFDNGITWSTGFGGFLTNIVSAVAVDPVGLLFAGSSGGVFRSHNDGLSWERISPDSLNPLGLQLTINPRGDILASGIFKIFRSSDKGLSWNLIYNDIENENFINALAVTNDGHYFSGTSGRILRSIDNGESWEQVFDGLHDMRSVIAYRDSIIYVGGKNIFLWSPNQGVDWVREKVPGFGIVNAVTVDSTGKVLVGMIGDGIYYSTENGRHWVQSHFLNTTVTAFAASSETLFAGTTYGVFCTSNAGRSWTKTGLVSQDIHSLVTSVSGDLFAATYDSIFRSDDSGNNWTRTKVSSTGSFCLSISPQGDLFVGAAGIFRSRDRSKTWSNIGLRDEIVYSIAINSNGDIFAGCGSGKIFRSTDGGNTWVKIFQAGTSAEILSLEINSAGHIFMAPYDDHVYRSTNNGDNWALIFREPFSNHEVRAIALDRKGNIFIGTNSGVFWSADNGTNWIRQNNGLTNKLVSSLGFDFNGHLFAGTIGGGAFIRVDTTTSVEERSDTPLKSFSLNQNYPNPFNPSTTIEFVLPHKSHVTLKIYDIFGRELHILINESLSAGKHQIEWNAAGISSGIYFYLLQADTFKQSKKLIVMK